ncbi:MAG: hypothetical protein ACOH2H_12965 [Cypionkella sp.]
MPKFPTKPATLLLLALAAAVPSGLMVTMAQAETAIAPEKNPPGDIPDSQAFVSYTSTAGYALKVPEGWARSDAAAGVSFVSKLDGLSVTLSDQPTAPNLDWVKQTYVPEMIAKGRAVKVDKVSTEKLPAGQVIKIAYSLNSEPNPVTTKQIRLEANRYLFFKTGKLAALDLYAPFGADNVDQWQLMSQSFAWQ